MHTTAREGAREGLASGQLNAGTQPLSRYIFFFSLTSCLCFSLNIGFILSHFP